MSDEAPKATDPPARLKIDTDSLSSVTAADPTRPPARLLVRRGELAPSADSTTIETRRWLLPALLLTGVVTAIGVVGLLIAVVGPEPGAAPTEVIERVPVDDEVRTIRNGELNLIAPSVSARTTGWFRKAWYGTATVWRMSDDNHLLLVTNAHVAQGDNQEPARLQVEFHAGKTASVTAIGIAVDRDLAILSVDADGLSEGIDYTLMSPQSETEWSSLAPGDSVVAVGTPLGYPQTQTFGRISALRDSLPQAEISGVRLLQVDANVLPGNSGGPLLRLEQGRWTWIGVITARGASGIGIAIHTSEIASARYRWVLGRAPKFDAAPALPDR